MGAELDRLEIEVEAQATKANNQLDKLVGKLDRVSSALSNLNSGGLTGLANGVAKFAQASAQLSNVKTADFTRLTKNIQSLANLNTQQIYGAASAMRTLSTSINSLGGVSASSLQVAQVAKDISKLGNKSVQTAITNLPALSTAMNNFMTTMARAPQVSQNIINMTNALANLASQGARVGTASNSLTNSVNHVGNAMSANTKKAKSFASVIGSLYQQFFWVKRGIDKLWDSIENSMNYVETLNYFDAAFGQVADAAVSHWEQAGYDSADAYYNSFSNRATELTSKMTGFTINDDGTLTATGEASLGINPSKLMNYQAMFAQMSSSMGVTSETSLKLSQALTEIGADLASVKNMDFDKVWTDMASGLAGMSRTLDKYGVNIRNVNLQQKLFDLGINENITNLNQNDKALLRAIILLDSTKYAWGDLADTLNQPANQMRLLTSNLSNLSRTIGNLFLPMVSKVLPYVNGLVIALQRLATWLGNLMGIDLSEVTSAVGSSEVDFGSLLDDADDLTDSLNDASDAAKKLKSNLQGFDELNVITTQEDTSSVGDIGGLSSGLLDAAFEDAFSEYQKAWDEAFANMENRAQGFADKIEKYFKPIKDIIEDFSIGDYFKAGQDTSKLVSGIVQAMTLAIEELGNSDVFREIGQNIVDFICGVDWLDLAWDFGLLADAITDALGRSSGDLVGGLLEGLIKNRAQKLGINIEIPDLSWLSDLGELTWSISFPNIGSLVSFLEDPEKELEKVNRIFEGIGANAETIFSDLQKVWTEFTAWWQTTGKEKWFKLSGAMNLGLVSQWDDFLGWWKTTGIYTWLKEDVEPWLSESKWFELSTGMNLGILSQWSKFSAAWKETGVYKWYESVKPYFDKEKWSFDGIKDGLSEAWEGAIESIKGLWNKFAEWLNEKLTINIDTGSLIGKGISEVLGTTKISFGTLPTFYTGGFPEDGLFMANHSELVGQFANGKTAVANNEQIIDGIKYGVREAIVEVLAPYLADIAQNTRETADKEFGISYSDVGKASRQYAKDYHNRTGREAYNF